MVEWIGLFVSAVGVVLQRISDKEKKLKQRTDVKDALMELLHHVRAWERFAERTNQALLEWISKEKTEDERLYREALRHATIRQSARAGSVIHSMGLSEDYPPIYETQPSGPPKISTIADLFHVYAPDLEVNVRKVLDTRLLQLQILIEGLDQGGVEDIHEAVTTLEPEVEKERWIPYDHVSEELARRYEHSAKLLKELSEALTSYIRQHWDVREITLDS
jgi:hypothetical protein